jgi:hypothetical protein
MVWGENVVCDSLIEFKKYDAQVALALASAPTPSDNVYG